MDKSFDKVYSIELPKLPFGASELEWDIDDGFFKHFELSIVKAGAVHVRARVVKYLTHLDITYNFDGTIMLECDRCTELFPHPIHSEQRVFYTFEDTVGLDKENDDVKSIERDEPLLPVADDFYDFINLEAPIRKVPEVSVHRCPPEIYKLLGLDEDGEEIGGEKTPVDPRWAKLKGLVDDSEE